MRRIMFHLTNVACAGFLACAPGVALAAPQAATSSVETATPAVKTSEKGKNGPGTTIISAQESPIGLYITPWKNAFTKQGMYAPRNHRMEIMPEQVDPGTFHLQNLYYDTITAFRSRELSAHGAAPASSPHKGASSAPQQP